MKTTVKTMMLLIAMVLTLSSCKKDDNTGSVQVKVTDDPFPYKFVDLAIVKITKVELKNTDGEYVTVFEGNAGINLVDHRNGVTSDIAVQAIPAGTYKGVKVTIDGAEIVLSNGTNFSVSPSVNSTVETQITPALTVVKNEDQEILLDIDLSDSFTFSGVMGGWISSVTQITGISSFHPDIRVANLDLSGAVSGVVKDANGNPVADAEVKVKYDYDNDGIDEDIVTIADANGYYKILGLPAGTYKVEVETENHGEADIDNVSIQVEQTTTVDVTVN